MRFMTSGNSVRLSAIIVALLSLSLRAAWAQDKPYVMKVTTATINDAPHQFIKDFAAAVERDRAVGSSPKSTPRAS